MMDLNEGEFKLFFRSDIQKASGFFTGDQILRLNKDIFLRELTSNASDVSLSSGFYFLLPDLEHI